MKLKQDLGYIYLTDNSTKKSHYGIFECSECKKHIKTRFNDVKKSKTNKCRRCANKTNNIIHNETKSRLYNIRKMMIQRCTNPKATKYNLYGGRGINICDEWLRSYESFRDWALSNNYSDDLSIDRKDNDKGYSPDNCRWVTKSVQSANTRKIISTNTSGYRGVSFHKIKQLWRAEIRFNKTYKHLGYFKDKDDAAKAYDNFIIENNLANTKNFN